MDIAVQNGLRKREPMRRYYNDFSDLDSKNALGHYGVPGMKWGVRKDPGYHAARTGWGTKRMARRDAKETARAKMYYGEGAGNRRKFIKNQVSQRSKDKFYRQMYDESLSKQNMDKHVAAAKRERHTRDAAEFGWEHRAAIASGVVAGAAALHTTGLDKKIINAGRDAFDSMRANATYRPYTVDDMLSGRMG